MATGKVQSANRQLCMGAICWPTKKLGPKTALSTRQPEWGPLGGPMTWWQNVAISTISVYRGSFDCPMTKWGQTVAISTISLYEGPSGGPVVKCGQNMEISRIWSRIWTFPQSAYIGGPFEAPLTM